MRILRPLFAGLFGFSAAKAAVPVATKDSEGGMREMRIGWLTGTPQMSKDTSPDQVIAVIMDWPVADHIISVLSSSAGDASLYTTSSFGIMGGIGHERVRNAAEAFVAVAQNYTKSAIPTKEYPYPDKKTLFFYLLTPSGVRRITFPLSDIERLDSPARALFGASQNVVHELRLIAPASK